MLAAMLAASDPVARGAVDAPCILDIEASGFGRGSYPIEVGFVTPEGASFCTLIRPAAHWTHWDPSAERVHGLSRREIERNGRPPALVARILNRDLYGCAVYSDGWAHDSSWLSLLFDEAGVQPRFRLLHLRELLTEAQAERWNATRQRVLSQMHLSRHRASSDARALQLTLLAVRRGAAAAPL
jgi:hypothetical protein